MRAIKSQIEEKKIEINTIKEAQNGELVVIMQNGGGKVNDLKQVLIEKIGGPIKIRPAIKDQIRILYGRSSPKCDQKYYEPGKHW